MAGPSHLVALFVVTAGQNAENLGTDEEQIILCVYLLYDIVNNKINSVLVQYVSPRHNDIANENILTPECKIQTGIMEDVIRAAQPLEQVLDEFERFIRTKEVHPDHGGNSFVFICDGPLHLRMCIHAEAAKRNINLPQHFYRYFDIRKAFKSFYKLPIVNCIKDMLELLGIEEDSGVDYGVRHCQDISAILHRLISDGYQFEEPCIIKSKLEQGICNISDVVDDDTIVRARGLPWQSSDQDIARFFQGLNIEKGGVALCLSPQGRRNGEALIRFVDKESRDLALRKHKHHLGQRYIEVYRASGRDFLNVAGGNSSEAQTFLSRHSDIGGQVIIRMRGLPYSATSEQVLNFFKNGDRCDVLDKEKGLLFVHQTDGRATGDAFVLFSNEEDASRALTKHRQCIGSRYIELFKSTTAEVQQVLNRSLDPRMSNHEVIMNPFPDMLSASLTGLNTPNIVSYQDIPGITTGLNTALSAHGINNGLNPQLATTLAPAINPAFNATLNPINNTTLAPSFVTSMNPNISNGFNGLTPTLSAPTPIKASIANGINTSSPIPGIVLPQHVITSGTQRDCIRLKGLPYEATVTDILNFLSEHSRNIVFQGVHMVYNSQGSLSGEAFIQMDSENSAEIAALLKDRKFMILNGSNKKRYVEVVQCCGQDMNLVLTNGTQTTASSNNTIMPGIMGPAPNLLPSVTPNPLLFQMQRPMLSPGGVLFQNPSLFPPTTPGTANISGLITHNINPAQNLIANATTNGLLTPSLPQMRAPYISPGNAPPGFIYWYPSPPVSPQSQPIFMPANTKTTTTTTATVPPNCATSVIVKGLPFHSQASDVLTLFDGIYDIQPEIEILRGSDGRHMGEAIVTFGTRHEAERGIIERNRKMVGQRFVELHMA